MENSAERAPEREVGSPVLPLYDLSVLSPILYLSTTSQLPRCKMQIQRQEEIEIIE